MNLLKWFLPVQKIEFLIHAPLEHCLEQVEAYQAYENRYVVALRPQLKLESIENGETYELWANDGWAAIILSVELERDGDSTLVSGHARFSIAPILFIVLIIGMFIFPVLLNPDMDAPLGLLICPVFVWVWLSFSYAIKRGSLVRHVRHILSYAAKRK